MKLKLGKKLSIVYIHHQFKFSDICGKYLSVWPRYYIIGIFAILRPNNDLIRILKETIK